MAHVRLSRAQRKWMVRAELSESIYDIHTVNSIAKLIGIKPSSYLRGILDDMVADGWIVAEEWTDGAGNVVKRWYALASRMPTQFDLLQTVYEMVGE